MTWNQEGFVLLSDIFPPPDRNPMPMVHAFRLTRWELDAELEKAKELPEHLRTNIRVVPATLSFEG